ncbi:MAG: hypothetical protein QOE59_1834, partial [Actinomycetota bacterium]|nr:hypothetical protein [Actinomycetota bacterium]
GTRPTSPHRPGPPRTYGSGHRRWRTTRGGDAGRGLADLRVTRTLRPRANSVLPGPARRAHTPAGEAIDPVWTGAPRTLSGRGRPRFFMDRRAAHTRAEAVDGAGGRSTMITGRSGSGRPGPAAATSRRILGGRRRHRRCSRWCSRRGTGSSSALRRTRRRRRAHRRRRTYGPQRVRDAQVHREPSAPRLRVCAGRPGPHRTERHLAQSVCATRGSTYWIGTGGSSGAIEPGSPSRSASWRG